MKKKIRIQTIRIGGPIIHLMKISLFQLSLAIVFAGVSLAGDVTAQELLNRRVSLRLDNQNLVTALTTIEKQADVRFTYRPKLFASNQRVSLTATNESLAQVLDRILVPLQVKYRVISNQIILSPIKGTVAGEQTGQLTPMANPNAEAPADPQDQSISGKVTDENGNGMPGVSIVLKGTQRGTTSNTDGNYSIAVPNGNAVLVFSFVGYLSQEVAVGNRSSVNVALSVDNKSLSEVVVVGYGTQERKDVTSAVSSVKAAELKDLPVAQFGQKLQGKLAGVQISQTTGQPGQGLSFRVRGAYSISAGNAPLFVVDGFPVTGGINNINPDEIESISLLKDAASAALYGSRAANGVVLITTKRAKEGQSRVDVSYYRGVQAVPQRGRPDMMNAQEFAQFQKELYEDRKEPVPADYQNPAQYGEGTNWYNEILRTAPIQNLSVSFLSGTERSKSAISAGYFKQEGVLYGTGYERFSFRANNDYTVGRVKVGFNLAPTYQINQNLGTDGFPFGGGAAIVGQALLASPLVPAINPDGSRPYVVGSAGMLATANPYVILTERQNKFKSLRTLANAYAQVNIVDGLTYQLRTDIDFESGNNYYFSPSTTGGIFAPPPQQATGSYGNFQQFSWLVENQLMYAKRINQHNIDAIAAYTAQKFTQENSNINANGYPNDRIGWIDAAGTRVGNANTTAWSIASMLARVNYSFKDRYLLSVAFRRDGSSRFGPLNRWGNFPSVSAGWIISDEPGLSKLFTGPLNFLKLRGSYGVTGNFNIGNFSYLSNLNTTNYVLGGALVSGSSLANLGNQTLGWERSTQTDIGLDFGLLNNRVNVELDYYQKRTTDLLYNVNIPSASGFNSVQTNVGELKFWGFEASVSTKNTVGALRWNTDLNLTIPRNRVEKLGLTNTRIGGYDFFGDMNSLAVGQPIGMFYGFIKDGVYVSKSDFDSSPKPELPLAFTTFAGPGTAKMRDVNGDGKITYDDRTFIGNPNPKWIFGITNTFAYKNFDIAVVTAGSVGHQIFNQGEQYTLNLDGVFNLRKVAAQRWRSESNPGNGQIASTAPGSSPLDRTGNTFSVYDGSYLRIQNLTVGYTPSVKTKFFKSARLYASAQNLYVFSKYVSKNGGQNPEVSFTGLGNGGGTAFGMGVDIGAYPLPRSITVGVNLSF